MKQFWLLGLACLFLYSCNEPEPSPYKDIEFVKVSQHPTGGRSTAVSFVIGDTAYVALGRKSRFGNALSDCWAYYPETDLWSQKRDFPGQARVNATAQVVNNKAYVGLGYYPDQNSVYTGSNYLNDWWMYNATTNNWIQKASLPKSDTDNAPYTSGCVSFVYKNDIYLGAGFNGYSFNSEFWKYCTENDKWTKLKNFNGPSRAIGTGAVSGNKYYFGTGYNTNTLNDWWEYEIEIDSWTKKKNMPDKGRLNALSFSIDSRIYVATGRRFGGDQTTGKLYADIMEYDIKKNQWYRRATIPDGNRENAISFVLKNKVYIGFGENDKTVLNDLWSFNPSNE